MRTATRRIAAVLMVTCVAMLLVATGGTARSTATRAMSAAGQATTESTPGRHLAVSTPSQHDQLQLHLDLASTPPEPFEPILTPTISTVPSDAQTRLSAGTPAPLGRAPPTL
ncbi:hypothetical protein [Aeromicrobium sp. P5_D10]